MQTIICFGAMMSTAMGLTFLQSSDESTVNEWDHEHNHQLSDDKVFVGMKSWHSNVKEDRKFKMYYGEAEEDGFVCGDSSWSSVQNEYDGWFDFACPTNQALRGIKSWHHDDFEDRKFQFKCCDYTSNDKYYEHSRQKTAYLNDYDAEVNYKCNPNEVMVGLRSKHWNEKEDRKFAVWCALVQSTENPLSFMTNRELTGYQNEFKETWQWQANAGRVVTGMRSEHSNSNEDRRFRFYDSMDPSGMTCDNHDWTDYQCEYDEHCEFICPSNSVVVGMGSEYSSVKKDRIFKFRCCEVGGDFAVTSVKHMGYSNSMDDDQYEKCASNEAMIGLQSYHSNSHEDRRFELICGRVALDFDDCVGIEVTSFTVGDNILIEENEVEYHVNDYEAEFDQCGNPNSGSGTLHVEQAKTVQISETFSLTESLEKTFSFSQTLETTFTLGTEVKGGVEAGVFSAEAAFSSSFSLRTEFAAGQEFSMSSSSTEETQTSTEDLSVFGIQTDYESKAFQWQKITTTYIEHKITVPLTMEVQCERKDGGFKIKEIGTKIVAGVRDLIIVENEDRTHLCEQSYYHNCECVPMSSDYITGDMGCSVHPNWPGQDGQKGCYTYRGGGNTDTCGGLMGLATAPPPANSCVSTTDFDACPGSPSSLDFPLDSYKFEWSYKACQPAYQCGTAVTVSGAPSFQSYSNGVYYWDQVTIQSERPVYHNADKSRYLYYWAPWGDWRVSHDYTQGLAGLYTDTDEFCPTGEDLSWYAWNSEWVSSNVAVHSDGECEDDATWQSSTATTCAEYNEYEYCVNGSVNDDIWSDDWDDIEDYAVNGVDASMACCACKWSALGRRLEDEHRQGGQGGESAGTNPAHAPLRKFGMAGELNAPGH